MRKVIASFNMEEHTYMQRSAADPLLRALQEVVELLKAHNERRWAFRLEGDLERLQEGDTGALEHLLSAYGGMGSFSDLYLCEQNGHKLSIGETSPINEHLHALASRIWQLARDRQRDEGQVS